MSDLQMFQYSSVELDNASTEIRLLDLYPPQANEVASDWEKPLVCRIFKTNISNPSLYKALSYVWGEGGKTESIWVIDLPGKSGEVSIPITESLDTALRHLRRPEETVTLWIDQICIDQTDNKEKGEQVSMMGRIYSAATQVLVWLGPAADGSDDLVNAWQDVGQKARAYGLEDYMNGEYGTFAPIMMNEDPTDEATIQFQDLLKHTADTLAPLLENNTFKAWLRRPYFSRLWTIQEFCLCADTVFVCGTKVVSVDLVKLAMAMLQAVVSNFKEWVPKLQQPNFITERLKENSEESLTRLFDCRSSQQNRVQDELCVLLCRMFVDHDTQATQHRDRVFALLGLAADTEKLGIQVDYGCTTEHALTQTASALIKAGRVGVLCYSQFPKQHDLAGLPSWVPDWRSNLRPSFNENNGRMNKNLFSASGKDSGVELAEPATESAVVLGLGGYTVDVIEKVAEGQGWMDLSYEPFRLLGFLAQVNILWQESMKKPIVPDGPTESRKAEARWRVPIGDLHKADDGDQHRLTPAMARSYEQCVQKLKVYRRVVLEEDDEQDIQDLERLDEEIEMDYDSDMRKMKGKKPFLTQMGYLGMGPGEGKPGDLVVAFCGGCIPFVLRPESAGSDMFSYVGEAYCDGVMDGEVTTKEKQTFWLV